MYINNSINQSAIHEGVVNFICKNIYYASLKINICPIPICCSNNRLYISLAYGVRLLLDQSIWETSVNLPPNFAITGLLLANLIAFCVPFAFAIVCGLGFRALDSAFSNTGLLKQGQIESGVKFKLTNC